MIDFDEAINRLMTHEDLDRPGAIKFLRDLRDEGDPEVAKVTDLDSNLLKERAEAIPRLTGAGVLHGALALPEEAARKLTELYIGPSATAEAEGTGAVGEFQPLAKTERAIIGESEPTPYAYGAGELVGSALPFTGGESLAAETIPALARHDLIRRALVGGGLGYADTGTPQGAAYGAIGGAAIPPVIDAAAHLVGRGLGALFGGAAEQAGEALSPKPEQVIGVTPAAPEPAAPAEPITLKPEDITHVTPPPPVATPETNAEAAMRTILGPRPSEGSKTLEAAQRTMTPAEPTPGFLKTAEQKLYEDENKIPVGTVNLRTGQPFTGERTVLLSNEPARVLVNPDHPLASQGTPAGVDLKNPAVLNVRDNPYREALEQVYGDQPKVLEAFDKANKPNDVAQEFLGRFAKDKGYDAVVLRTPDPRGDMILDFRDFKTHPMKSDLSLVGSETNPPRSIFARNVREAGEPEPQEPEPTNYGFKDDKEMAQAIHDAHMTPFEAFAKSQKVLRGAVPKDITTEGVETPKGGFKPGVEGYTELSKAHPELADALRVIGGRHPELMGQVQSFRVEAFGPEFNNTAALTWIDDAGKLHINFNRNFMHDTAGGQGFMQRLKRTDPREFYSTILEHEMTHVGQYWADTQGLNKTLGVPSMRGESGDPNARATWQGPRITSEQQAEGREARLQRFFDNHRALQARVAQIPPEVQARVLRAEGEQLRLSVKAELRKAPRYQPVKKGMARTTEQAMDGFDVMSRSVADSQADPDRLLPQETKQQIGEIKKWKENWTAFITTPNRTTDNPEAVRAYNMIQKFGRKKLKVLSRFMRLSARLLDKHGINESNQDQLWEAVEGIRMTPDGRRVQTVPNLPPAIAKAADDFRKLVYDPIWRYVKGYDGRAAVIMREMGVPETETSFWRLRQIQIGGPVKDPTPVEIQAAERTRGMLHFDESHDLSAQYINGYLTHQPIDNELAELQDQIKQIQLAGSNNPGDIDILKERISRVKQVQARLEDRAKRSLPNRDMVPKKQFFGPMSVSRNPDAAEMLLDKDFKQVEGRYLSGAISKRFFDQALNEYTKVKDLLSPAEKDRFVQYLNNMRGVRGYREDQWITNVVSTINQALGRQEVSIKDVRAAAREMLGLNNVLKLYWNQVRFPLMQAGHVGLTDFVVDPKATRMGIGYVTAHLKSSMMQAMAEGVIERDEAFLSAVDDNRPLSESKLMRLLSTGARFSDYWRKAVTYHGFRLRAMEPDFKPSPVIRSHIKEVPGRNIIRTARDYGVAAAHDLQFSFSSESKPQAFVGGVVRRTIGQYKQWPINIMGLYRDVFFRGDAAMKARLVGTLFVYGGASFGTTDILWHVLRNEAVKHGDALPKGLRSFLINDQPGWQLVANQLGIGETFRDVNVMSMARPLGLPQKVGDIPTWLAGPTIGGVYEYAKGLEESHDPARTVGSTISAVSPQLRAALDAAEEYRHGGVSSPTGRIIARRPLSSIIIRGLDLSPSVKSTRQRYLKDTEQALEAGQIDTAKSLLQDAQSRGMLFSRQDIARLKGEARYARRVAQLRQQDPERYVE